MNNIWPIFLVLGAMCAFILFVFAVKKWPPLGVATVVVNIVVAWEFPVAAPVASILGTNIFAVDVISVLFVILAALNAGQIRRNLGNLTWLWFSLCILLVFSFIRGVLAFNLGTTTTEFRLFLYPIATITWAMSLAWTKELVNALIVKASVVTGILLSIVAAINIFRYGLGGASEYVDQGSDIVQTARPLVSGQALILLLCAIVCLQRWRANRRKAQFFVALLFLAVVVIVQQRTVWAVGLACLIVTILLGTWQARARIASVVGLTCAVIASVASQQSQNGFFEKILTAAGDTGTYEGRVTSWKNLIEESYSNGAHTILFGAPFGAGFGRFEGIDRWVEFAPHNWYLTIYLRVGLVGLSAFLLFITIPLIACIQNKRNIVIICIQTALLVFGWSYSWIWYAGVYIGWAYASTRGPKLLREDDSMLAYAQQDSRPVPRISK